MVSLPTNTKEVVPEDSPASPSLLNPVACNADPEHPYGKKGRACRIFWRRAERVYDRT